MTRSFRSNVGVIGLGIIGRGIANHLRRRGLNVFVWNRTPRPVPNFVGSPAELAQTCNYLQIFVSDDDALMRIIQVISPSLSSSHVLIAHPTVAPETIQSAAALVERRGARLVEAPFTGSKVAAQNGQLVYYVGGDEAAVRQVRPLLEASSKTIVDIGGIGQASIIKVATNLITAATVQASAEAMALVHHSGIQLEKFAEALRHNGSNSATLDMKVPRIITADFEPHFSLKHMLKDMQIANRLARQVDIDLSLASATRDRLLEEARNGRGELDYCAIAEYFLPLAQRQPVKEQQPDLFSQPTPHESTEFIEQQLAQLEAALPIQTPPVPAPEYADEPARANHSPVASDSNGEAEPDKVTEIIPGPEQEQIEQQHATAEPVSESESAVPKLGFLKRLLTRADTEGQEYEPTDAPEPEAREENSPAQHEGEEDKRGFISRFLGRTADY